MKVTITREDSTSWMIAHSWEEVIHIIQEELENGHELSNLVVEQYLEV